MVEILQYNTLGRCDVFHSRNRHECNIPFPKNSAIVFFPNGKITRLAEFAVIAIDLNASIRDSSIIGIDGNRVLFS